MGPRQLDGGLVGLGAAVAEEALAAERPFRELLRQRSLGLHVPGIGHVDQPADLFANRRDDPLGAMAQQVAAPTGEEVEIAVSLGVPHPGTLAANQADGESSIVGYHIAIELGDRRRLCPTLAGCDCGKGVTPIRFDTAPKGPQNESPGNALGNQGFSRTRPVRRRGVTVLAADDLGAGAALGEDLEKQRVAQSAVNDVGLAGRRIPGW